MSKSCEEEVIAKLHELSMARDGYKASFGRLAKDVMPAFVEALTNEMERETPISELAFAVTMLTVGVTLATMTFVSPDRRQELAGVMASAFKKELMMSVGREGVFKGES